MKCHDCGSDAGVFTRCSACYALRRGRTEAKAGTRSPAHAFEAAWRVCNQCGYLNGRHAEGCTS